MMKRIGPYWPCALLSVPAIGFAVLLAQTPTVETREEVIHASGGFAARSMIVAMLASPLVLLLKGWRGPQWITVSR